MGLPPTPASARLAACTPGPLCLSTYIYTPFSFPPLLSLSPSFSTSPLHTLRPPPLHLPLLRKQEINLPPPHLRIPPSVLSFFPPPPPIAAVSLCFFSCCCFFSPPFVTLRRALISLAVAAQLILLQYGGLLFMSHKGLLPRPPASPGKADG